MEKTPTINIFSGDAYADHCFLEKQDVADLVLFVKQCKEGRRRIRADLSNFSGWMTHAHICLMVRREQMYSLRHRVCSFVMQGQYEQARRYIDLNMLLEKDVNLSIGCACHGIQWDSTSFHMVCGSQYFSLKPTTFHQH